MQLKIHANLFKHSATLICTIAIRPAYLVYLHVYIIAILYIVKVSVDALYLIPCKPVYVIMSSQQLIVCSLLIIGKNVYMLFTEIEIRK